MNSKPYIGINTRGLWQKKWMIEELTGLTPRFFSISAQARDFTAIAGWGVKKTSTKSRNTAQKRGKSYIAFEDGFLRSVAPGNSEPPFSMVMDKQGIYYDARKPSDLETMLLACDLNDETYEDANRAIKLLQDLRLAKYNNAPLVASPPKSTSNGRVLVIDQTFDDAAIIGGLANQATFTTMLDAAMAENPIDKVVVKLHPEVIQGRKQGYLAQLALQRGVQILSDPANPWDLCRQFERIYTVTSQFGFEALMAGVPVSTFGVPFYAGWGLCDDRGSVPKRRNRVLKLEDLVATVFFKYCHYFDAWDKCRSDFWTVCEQLAFLRDHYHNRSQAVAIYGVSRWKRQPINRMLHSHFGPPVYSSNLKYLRQICTTQNRQLASWGAKARHLREEGETSLITIEDGFLRSVGLGVSFTPSMSYVFDDVGIYYDPSRPSRLETILNEEDFTPEILGRAAKLRQLIVSEGLSKYNLTKPNNACAALALPKGREIILVPGQVADDESVRLGAPDYLAREKMANGGANLALLKAVRARHPDGFIIFKPHPDVVGRMRAGQISQADMTRLADLVIHDVPLSSLFEHVDRVETMTSLAGFEALLRGIAVSVHGMPFYAGWGISDDLQLNPRRIRVRTIDELVAGSLITYPYYADPKSQRPCTVEVVARRVLTMRQHHIKPLEKIITKILTLFACLRNFSLR